MIRRLAFVASTALVAGVTVLAPATPAHAADFGAVTISNLPTTIKLGTARTSVPFTVSFTGTPASSDVYYSGYDKSYNYASVAALQTNGVATVYPPYVTSPTVAPNTALAYTLELSAYKTPGRYRITVPIEQKVWNSATSTYDKVDHFATADFNLVATTAVTLEQSYLSGSGKFTKSAKWSWSVRTPDYERGATVKLYFKAKGAKKYVVVGTAKLNASGDATFKGKKGAIRKVGKVYFVLSKVPFAPVTKSGLYTIKKY
jgi:hypothetical protein